MSKTWTFDTSKAPTSMFPNLSVGNSQIYSVMFTSDGTAFVGIEFDRISSTGIDLYYKPSSNRSISAYTDEDGWVSNYKTVTFDEPPSGDLLTWLQANATPQ